MINTEKMREFIKDELKTDPEISMPRMTDLVQREFKVFVRKHILGYFVELTIMDLKRNG